MARAIKTAARVGSAAKLLEGVTVLETISRAIRIGRVARFALRSGVWGAAIDGGLGGFEALWALQKGELNADEARSHVLRRSTSGFVIGAAGSACAFVAVTYAGPGFAALAAGTLGAAGASKLFNHFVPPSPMEGVKAAGKGAGKSGVKRAKAKPAARTVRRRKA